LPDVSFEQLATEVLTLALAIASTPKTHHDSADGVEGKPGTSLARRIGGS
jgi:hypothetical protein